MQMSTNFSRFARNTRVLGNAHRSSQPLNEEHMVRYAPSIFADGKHESRSERYTYVPTIEVLRGLQKEGFQPFMVAQGNSRIPGKAEFSKHMIRMRHETQAQQGGEATEIILINSHDGTSSYQMLSGVFRFVCCNGLVVGDIFDTIRIPHKGNIQDDVIEGAFRVLDTFEKVKDDTAQMKALTLSREEQGVFADAALTLRFEDATADKPAPIEASTLNLPRRAEDTGNDLWTTFQRVQENVMQGGQHGRNARRQRTTTRPVNSIDRTVQLNRALWTLAEGMRALKA